MLHAKYITLEKSSFRPISS